MKQLNTLTKINLRGILSRLAFAFLILATLSAVAAVGRVEAQTAVPKKTIVLVHGTFADGSSWGKIIPLLQAKGLNVVAVQNPLTSLADDVAATRRAIEASPGEVVLVGHSWGGSVITEAGNDEKVTALVYVAAFAPSKNQSVSDVLKDYPKPEWFASAKADSGGFLTLQPAAISSFFAQDLPAHETSVMEATQAPVAARAFDDKITEAAWSVKPSWYVVAANDRMIFPDLERATAKKIGARATVVLQSSHVPMLSKPKEVADVILAACRLSKK